ncbi:hypothetical protein FRC17_002012 [Serendipita sp. 399]|nr:hypothetical protein FRC17_002012 [Serendipita sp. 399]
MPRIAPRFLVNGFHARLRLDKATKIQGRYKTQRAMCWISSVAFDYQTESQHRQQAEGPATQYAKPKLQACIGELEDIRFYLIYPFLAEFTNAPNVGHIASPHNYTETGIE